MHFGRFSFGSVQIDVTACEHDVVVDRGEVRKRRKRPSKQFRKQFGHTPLSIGEDIPWKCRQLVIGTGAYGRLPVMQEVRSNAERKKIKLLILPTIERGLTRSDVWVALRLMGNYEIRKYIVRCCRTPMILPEANKEQSPRNAWMSQQEDWRVRIARSVGRERNHALSQRQTKRPLR